MQEVVRNMKSPIAQGFSPDCARCVATSEEEQAVSVETQGPLSANVYDTLPTMKGNVLPVLAADDVSDTPCVPQPNPLTRYKVCSNGKTTASGEETI